MNNMYVVKEKKKPPVVVAKKSGTTIASGITKGNVDRSEIRTILHADNDREKKDAGATDPIDVKREVKLRTDQEKTPDDSEV